MIKKCFFLFVFLFQLSYLWAADHNVTLEEWEALTFTRGDTYFLATGTYAGKTLNTATSGTSYIYIKSSGTVTFTGQLAIATDYWDIDGVTGGGPTAWKSGHGIVFSTAACSALDTGYINLYDGADHIRVQRVKFVEVGTTTNCAGCNSTGPVTHAIYNAGTLTNSYFAYNYIDNLTGLSFFLRHGSGNIFEYNYSGEIGGSSTCDIDCHTETMVFWTMSDVHIRFNFFHKCPSSGCIVRNGLHATTSSDVRIYGNVMMDGGGGIVANYGANTDWRMLNNTFVRVNSPISDGGAQSWTSVAVNNLVWDVPTVIACGEIGAIAIYPPGTYSSLYAIDCSFCTSGAGATVKGITVLQPGACDIPDATYDRDPFVASGSDNFNLATAEDAGTNACTATSTTCNSTYKYNLDWTGATRSIWSRGAYEYTSGTAISIGAGITLGAGMSIQ